MHVYHYAPYERTALTRLMGEHATREDEIDDLLRGEVLVDLYRVTRQALRASLPRYSIKNVEELYGFERRAEVAGGSESVARFEHWLEIGDDSLLEGIREYNHEDCLSLYELHRWLLEQRPRDCRGARRRRSASERGGEERIAERARVRDRLLAGRRRASRAGSSRSSSSTTGARRSRSGGSTSTTCQLDDEELLDDGDTIGGLELDGEPVQVEAVVEYTFTFPAQEHKIRGTGVDPETEHEYDVRVDDEHGTLMLRRGASRARTSRCRRR